MSLVKASRKKRKNLGLHLSPDFVFPQTGAICMLSLVHSVWTARTSCLCPLLCCSTVWFESKVWRGWVICSQTSLHSLSGVNRPEHRCEHVEMDFMKLFGTVIAVLFHPGSASKINGKNSERSRRSHTLSSASALENYACLFIFLLLFFFRVKLIPKFFEVRSRKTRLCAKKKKLISCAPNPWWSVFKLSSLTRKKSNLKKSWSAQVCECWCWAGCTTATARDAVENWHQQSVCDGDHWSEVRRSEQGNWDIDLWPVLTETCRTHEPKYCSDME